MEAHAELTFERYQIWLGNLRPDITVKAIFNCLYGLGLRHFIVRMGRDYSPYYKPLDDAFCFVEFDDYKAGLDLRQLLEGRQARM